MPYAMIHCPKGVMDATDIERFMRDVKRVVAQQMDAVDPITKMETTYRHNPDKFIDLALEFYDSSNSQMTVPFVGQIMAYDWLDRMRDIDVRIRAITTEARACLNQDVLAGLKMRGWDLEGKLISFGFVPIPTGAWHAA